MPSKGSSSIVEVPAVFAMAGGSKTTAHEKEPSAAQSSPSVVPQPTAKVPVGDLAVAAVELADNPRIILDAAVIVVQCGQRTIDISSTQLAKRGRIPALKALEELGRAAAKRL